MQSYKNLAIFYNTIFDASKDVVLTLDYVAYDSIGVPSGGIIIGILPFYRVAPEGTSAGAGLGYSDDVSLSASGIYDAHFGLALDFNGFFAASGTGTAGLTSVVPNAITLRGPAINQYPLLATTGNLSSASTPFTLFSYSSASSAVEVKRVRVRLSNFGSKIVADTKSAQDVDFVNRITYADSYATADYVRLYCAFCVSVSTTHISVPNININAYDTTLTYCYSGASYLGLSANPAYLTETQYLSVVNVYPGSLGTTLSSLGPLILINNESSGAPYIADHVSTTQRYSLSSSATPSDSFIFIDYQ